MKRVMGGLILVFFACWPGIALSSELNIINPSICKNIVNHQPVGAGEVFGSDVNRLFCLTRVVGPYHVDKEQYVIHVWYYQEVERARVTLPVKSSNWGTYSSKIINSREVGPWHVDVLDPQGEIIKTLPFSIR
jgi:DUF2914 family protein